MTVQYTNFALACCALAATFLLLQHFAAGTALSDFLNGKVLHVASAELLDSSDAKALQYRVLVKSLVDKPVAIIGARLPCGCLSIDTLPVTVGSKGTIELRVTVERDNTTTPAWWIPLILDSESGELGIEIDSLKL